MRKHVIFTLSLFILTACAQVDYKNLTAQQRSSYTVQIAKRINTECPITNGNFRVDKAHTVEYGDKVVVTATALGTTYNEETNYEDFFSKEIAGEKNTYCNSPDFRYAREADIPFEFVYQDTDERLLYEFTVSNYICNEVVRVSNKSVVAPESASQSTEMSGSKQRLIELKSLYDESIISKEEYEQKRQSIFDEL